MINNEILWVINTTSEKNRGWYENNLGGLLHADVFFNLLKCNAK